MKRFVLIALLSTFFLLLLFASSETEIGKEKTAVMLAALDYIEGWYEGNAARMEKALHPELLVKTGIFQRPNSGRTQYRCLDAEMMVKRTQMGGGKNFPKEKQKNEITILDIYRNTATVKVVSAQYIDYLHIGKFDGEWKIVNVLWEMKREPGK